MIIKKTPIILANWKMNLGVADSVKLARQIVRLAGKALTQCELVLCPSFPALAAVSKEVSDKRVHLGAQDVFWKPSGPYTGEVSPTVLRELGVEYVIVGHSERRQYLNETDLMVHQKLIAVLAAQLIPVLCVGETFSERQAGRKDLVVARQVSAAVQGLQLSPKSQLVVTYEPVWVIGSGQAVEPEEAAHTARVIEQALIDELPVEVVKKQVRIIYGGSVDLTNIDSFVNTEPLRGVLVGGASLEAEKFVPLLKQL